ncbi:MAG: 30S ribosomal protein S3 [Minisyncoccia bacterium]
MAQKVKPTALRLGITKTWSSRWLYSRNKKFFLEEDFLIRKFLEKKLVESGLDRIDIERVGDEIKVIVRTSRPGLIIGKGGKGIEELTALLNKQIKKLRLKRKQNLNYVLKLNVEELKRNELSAQIIAQQIAFDLEKRMPYNKVMKKHLEAIAQNKNIYGAKIKLSGRLNGAEIARSAQLSIGKLPLQTLNIDIDYGEATAFNTYGTVGVKVWLNKGEIKTD